MALLEKDVKLGLQLVKWKEDYLKLDKTLYHQIGMCVVDCISSELEYLMDTWGVYIGEICTYLSFWVQLGAVFSSYLVFLLMKLCVSKDKICVLRLLPSILKNIGASVCFLNIMTELMVLEKIVGFHSILWCAYVAIFCLNSFCSRGP